MRNRVTILSNRCLLPTLARLALLLASLTSCNHVFYQPTAIVYVTPDRLEQTFQEISVETEDGLELSGWVMPTARNDFGTLIQFHGNAQNMSAHFLYVHWLVNFGFNVVVFDYRGYGKSEGVPSRSGLIKDGVAVLKYVRQHPDLGSKGYFVLGQSLGGAVSVPSIVEAGQDGLRALLLDSTFSSYRVIAQDKLAGLWLTWPLQVPLSYLVSDDYSPVDYLGRLTVPVTVIHAKEDGIVPYRFGEEIFSRLPMQDKDFWKVKQGHISALASPESPFRPKLVDYLCSKSFDPQACLRQKAQVEADASAYDD